MESIDVRTWLGTQEAPRRLPRMIKTRDWDADLAYERLKVVRDVKDALQEGINKNSVEIPEAVANVYEEIYNKLITVESMEVETVRFGR